jgi:hypothetical protein
MNVGQPLRMPRSILPWENRNFAKAREKKALIQSRKAQLTTTPPARTWTRLVESRKQKIKNGISSAKTHEVSGGSIDPAGLELPGHHARCTPKSVLGEILAMLRAQQTRLQLLSLGLQVTRELRD